MFKTSSGGAKYDEHPYIQTHSEKEAVPGARKPGKVSGSLTSCVRIACLRRHRKLESVEVEYSRTSLVILIHIYNQEPQI